MFYTLSAAPESDKSTASVPPCHVTAHPLHASTSCEKSFSQFGNTTYSSNTPRFICQAAFGVFLLLVESPLLVTLRFVRRSHPKPEEPEILRLITFQLLKGAPVRRRFHFPKWAVRTGLRTGKTQQNVLGFSPHHRYLSVEPLEDRRLLAVGLQLGVTIQAAAAPTFNLTAPTSGTFTVGQTVPIQWTAGNVAAGSTVALCYDTDTSFGGATWITFGQAATAPAPTIGTPPACRRARTISAATSIRAARRTTPT